MSKRRNVSGYREYMNERVYVEPRRLPSHMLMLDPEYQRKVDMKRVQKIVDDFNPYLVNPLKVSHRDGAYYVIDGGHTLMALKIVKGGRETFPVECRVYENLTREEENTVFALQTGYSKPISVEDEMNALRNGKDEETLDIISIVRESGLKLAIREGGEKSIHALSKVRSLYRKYGRDICLDAFKLVNETWEGSKSSLTANILGGMCVFIKEFRDCYLKSRFLKKLKDEDPDSIRTAAKRSRASFQTLDAAVATEIARIYNHGGGKGRISPGRTAYIMEN